MLYTATSITPLPLTIDLDMILSVCRWWGSTCLPGPPSAVQSVWFWDLRAWRSGEGMLWRNLQLRGSEGGLREHPRYSYVTCFSGMSMTPLFGLHRTNDVLVLCCFSSFSRRFFGSPTLQVRQWDRHPTLERVILNLNNQIWWPQYVYVLRAVVSCLLPG